jgi:hypothetical protein
LDDPFSDYLQRSVTISLGAGNDADANAAIQTIDPWPPYVGYTRIPGDGRRMVGAVEQLYRTPNPFGQGSAGGSAGGSSATPSSTLNIGTSPSTPMQPISGY